MRNFTYLIEDSGEALVIDPQDNLSPWTEVLHKTHSQLKGILLTHSHHDHVRGLKVIPIPVPIFLHTYESFRFKNWPEDILNRFQFIEDNELISCGNLQIKVIHSPGHSPGELCYLLEENAKTYLFSGDTVFVGDVGRTDLEGGNTTDLFQTIQKLKQLKPDTIIMPGHHYGQFPTSTIETEIQTSKAFQCKTVEELDELP